MCLSSTVQRGVRFQWLIAPWGITLFLALRSLITFYSVTHYANLSEAHRTSIRYLGGAFDWLAGILLILALAYCFPTFGNNTPPDDGTLSIGGAGLQNAKESNRLKPHWRFALMLCIYTLLYGGLMLCEYQSIARFLK